MVAFATFLLGTTAAAAETPDVSIDPTVHAGYVSAEVSGTINPHGERVLVYGEYFRVGEPNSGAYRYITEIPAGSTGPVGVSGMVHGLEPGLSYEFRLIAEIPGGSETRSPAPNPTATTKTGTKPSATIGQVSAVTATTANLSGLVNPNAPEAEPTGPEVEEAFTTRWHFECTPACGTPEGNPVEADDSPHGVEAVATSLSPGTEYTVSLTAESAFGSQTSATTTFVTAAAAPLVDQPSVVEVTANSATLRARVNPRGSPTTFHFEYVTDQRFDESGFTDALKTPDERLGAGAGYIRVETHVEGLVLTTYHFRIVAANSVGTAIGAPAIFTARPVPIAPNLNCGNDPLRIGFAANLPDCRAYEQVTPPGVFDKNAASFIGSPLNVLAASPSGDATSYYSGTGAGTESAMNYPIYIATRTPNGWISEGINPPPYTGTELFRLAYTNNLRGSYSIAASNTVGHPGSLYFRRAGGQLTRIAPDRGEAKAGIAAESADENLVLFESTESLAPDAVRGIRNVYIWDKSTGAISEVDVLPGGGLAPEGAVAGPQKWFQVEPLLPGGGSIDEYYTDTTLNESGTIAFFTDLQTGQIYMRRDPAAPSATTVQISDTRKSNGSGPDGADPNGVQQASFLEATPSGEYVFFQSRSELTNDANTGVGDEGRDLYRYDTATGSLLDISSDSTDESGADVLGLAGISNDGGAAFFVAESALAPESTAERPNLYRWQEGQPIEFVAEVGPEYKNPDEEIYAGTRFSGGRLGIKDVRVSADGRTVVFASSVNRPEFHVENTTQVYRWEVGASGLQCLSCSESDHGASFQETPEPLAQAQVERSRSTRFMSSNGDRVFFNTKDALVASDTNKATDVYEWEARGEGSCTQELFAGGCLNLISSGTSPDGSYLSDASENGDDVFFFTGQGLVRQDRDELYDVYDARVEGGIAAQSAVPPAPCVGENCRLLAPFPETQPRATTGTDGSGNLHQRPRRHRNHKKHRRRHGRRPKDRHGHRSNTRGVKEQSSTRKGKVK